MPYPGKMRQIAIDALMKTVEESDQIDQKTIDLLTQMKNLLATILSGASGEKVADDAVILGIINTANLCNTDGTTADENTHDNYTTQLGLHSTCRINKHSPATTNKDTLCQKVTNFMATYSPDSYCDDINELAETIQHAFNEKHADAIAVSDFASLIEKISDGYNHFAGSGTDNGLLGQQPQFKNKKEDCEGAVATWIADKEECDQLQTLTESAYCSWRGARQDMCSVRDACHAGQRAIHAAKAIEITEAGRTRTDTAFIIELATCIIDAMIRDDINDNTVTVCREDLMSDVPPAFKQTTRNNTYQTTITAYPDELACDLAAVEKVVGVNFQDWAYGDIPCRAEGDTCEVLPPTMESSGCGNSD